MILLSSILQAIVAFRAPFEAVAVSVEKSLSRYGAITRKRIATIDETAGYLSPISAAGNRHVLGRLTADWTMIIGNGFGAPNGRLYQQSKDLGSMAIGASWSASGAVLIVMEAGRDLRAITCIKNSNRWEFFSQGELLPFEEPKYYEAKNPRKRFPAELAVRYVSKLIGIEWPPAWDAVFRDVVALEYPPPKLKGEREEPLVNDLF